MPNADNPGPGESHEVHGRVIRVCCYRFLSQAHAKGLILCPNTLQIQHSAMYMQLMIWPQDGLYKPENKISC